MKQNKKRQKSRENGTIIMKSSFIYSLRTEEKNNGYTLTAVIIE